MSTRIYAADMVGLSLEKSNPPNLLIEARGRTNTSGWTNVALSAHQYITPPADGVQGFDFVATPPLPEGFVLQALTKVSANTVIPQIDISNFWGPNLPLKGIRCYAQTNTKQALFEAPLGMPEVAELPDAASSDPIVPLFARDVKPLFRDVDINMMIAVRNLDLGSFDVVSEHADLILERLKDGTMPCDGAWPDSDVDTFVRWISLGKQP
ncbi:MAG: hypothetical protein V7695_24065 [Sulfitobacter sp.]